MLPLERVEAIAVTTIRLICWAAEATILGIIRRIVFLITFERKLNIPLHRKPHILAATNCKRKYKKAPIITPQLTPITPNRSEKKTIDKIMDKL